MLVGDADALARRYGGHNSVPDYRGMLAQLGVTSVHLPEEGAGPDALLPTLAEAMVAVQSQPYGAVAEVLDEDKLNAVSHLAPVQVATPAPGGSGSGAHARAIARGSVLSRGTDGAPMTYPPVLWQIELQEALADTKVIAEARDAGGLYQVGHFRGFRWGEWNGVYRDDLRRFVRGEPGHVGVVAHRVSGSAALCQRSGHTPVNSISFVTAHDGLTLNDLVSYDRKHNAANGEDNRDGIDDNLSWNCGAKVRPKTPGSRGFGAGRSRISPRFSCSARASR